ncbi:hypothetical protein [uncultured Pseudoteredinibacter sp.]|uniref:hypothetical protein n=1 Tax=uncultured Pseudoteredinibacter sp. TaxID=1641701 RepID=UPI00260D2B5B|nr:hypothetical protein [uncultured Pseudoteredinibacter sp.]
MDLIGERDKISFDIKSQIIDYEVLRDINQLAEFLQSSQKSRIDQIEAAYAQSGGVIKPFHRYGIVTFRVDHGPQLEEFFTNAENIIFMGTVNLGRNLSHRYFDFSNCVFLQSLFLGQQPNYSQNLSLRLSNCEFYGVVSILMNIKFIDVDKSKFFYWQGLVISNATGERVSIRDSEISGSIQNSTFERISISNTTVLNSYFFSNVYVQRG